MSGREKASLKQKTRKWIILLSGLFCFATVALSMYLYTNMMVKQYKKMAINIAKTVAQLDIGKLESNLLTIEQNWDYHKMLEQLMFIKENNDVEFLRVIRSKNRGGYTIFDADRTNKKKKLSGPILIPERIMKGEVDTSFHKSEAGWLCFAYAPILNQNGEVEALTVVGISLDVLIANLIRFLITMITCIVAVTLLFMKKFYISLRKNILDPINNLAIATDEFVTSNDIVIMEKQEVIGGEIIHTNNEIETLSDKICLIENRIIGYIQSHAKLTEERDKMKEELNLAATIQAGLLPFVFNISPNQNEFNLYGSMNPAKEVRGDFYDTILIDEEHLGILVVDVGGEGVSANLFMLIVKSLIKTQSFYKSTPAEVFTKVNQKLYEGNRAGMFLAAFMGIFNLKTGILTYSNAGHKSPLLSKKGKHFQGFNDKPDFVLAGMEGIHYKNYQLQMEPGDRLMLYNDGLISVMNIASVPFGEMRLLEVLNHEKTHDLTLKGLNDYILENLKHFTLGTQRLKDITMLFFEFKAYKTENE